MSTESSDIHFSLIVVVVVAPDPEGSLACTEFPCANAHWNSFELHPVAVPPVPPDPEGSLAVAVPVPVLSAIIR